MRATFIAAAAMLIGSTSVAEEYILVTPEGPRLVVIEDGHVRIYKSPSENRPVYENPFFP
jgi:hypothetical protein